MCVRNTGDVWRGKKTGQGVGGGGAEDEMKNGSREEKRKKEGRKRGSKRSRVRWGGGKPHEIDGVMKGLKKMQGGKER